MIHYKVQDPRKRASFTWHLWVSRGALQGGTGSWKFLGCGTTTDEPSSTEKRRAATAGTPSARPPPPQGPFTATAFPSPPAMSSVAQRPAHPATSNLATLATPAALPATGLLEARHREDGSAHGKEDFVLARSQ
ncbi:uncharacterized protein LOC116269978 [Papio anubis]|uniref:uncharacterized protein LOC116269978 n=1 Tax=Papio anubis TaxID=9555 RepID=UPI0012ADC2D9|nr:uncharacterized protein LOC116269978 [Papio anubis]